MPKEREQPHKAKTKPIRRIRIRNKCNNCRAKLNGSRATTKNND